MKRHIAKSLLVGGALLAAMAVQAEWYLTSNAVDDMRPVTAGKLVAWEMDDGVDTEVMFYNGKTTVQLTENGFDDHSLFMAKKYLVWVQDLDGTGNLNEIMLWNGKEVVQVSNGGGLLAMSNPHTDGKYVVWEQDDGVDLEIMLWDGKVVTQLTTNAYDDNRPRVDKGRVVWYADEGGGDDEIFLWEKGVTTQLTTNTGDDQDPVIEGKLIAWIGDDLVNGDTDVFLFDGEVITNISTATGNVVGNLSLSKKCLAWAEDDTNDDEIFLWQKGVVTQVTNNDFDDNSVVNVGNKVVWLYNDPNGNNNQIAYHNSKGVITQITNSGNNRRIAFNGKSIVWERTEVDREIYIFPGKTKLP
jgi:hypothetical protein